VERLRSRLRLSGEKTVRGWKVEVGGRIRFEDGGRRGEGEGKG
jgi:hypothetical protein